MIGYWGDSERTAEVLNRGWMRTGDLGVIDEEGFCSIVGRIKDMVIRGGENIYPREIEEALYQHPEIEDVQVVGVPDEKYGEELVAVIIRKPQSSICEEDVRSFCKSRMAHYKVPRYTRFVEEFPLTVTGKVQKFVLRERLIAELGL
jgi:fatty-acyl-CoA synthase